MAKTVADNRKLGLVWSIGKSVVDGCMYMYETSGEKNVVKTIQRT